MRLILALIGTINFQISLLMLSGVVRLTLPSSWPHTTVFVVFLLLGTLRLTVAT